MTTGEAASGEGTAVQPPFDITKANQARMYDYMLGGKDHFEADRVAADAAVAILPNMAFAARANRAFLGRAVTYLTAEAGIRQFLDIGSGLPAAGNVHEVAQAIAPETRVAYVDYDPVVGAHARALLTSSPEGGTMFIGADARDTATILDQAADLLDFSEPVAITMLLLLHAIPDADDPHAIVARLLGTVPSGSYLVISHGASDLVDQETQEDIAGSWKGRMQQQITGRSRDQVMRFFDGTDLVEPGLVLLEEWRPAPDTAAEGPIPGGTSAGWCAVGRKR